MSQPTYLQQPNIVSLRRLLEEVASGEIRVPRFQRHFIWSDEQRILLLDSIYKGMPIGSILIWRTKNHDLKNFARIGALNVAGAAESKEDTVKQYLLDGYQRVTTLFSALGPGIVSIAESEQDTGDSADGLHIGDDSRALYFDLESRSFELEPKRTNPPPTWVPLSILLDPYLLYEFQKQVAEHPGGRSLLNRAEGLANTFKDYLVPLVPLASEDLDLVTESFQRVNSAGTKMDQVNMVNALLWRPGLDINDQMAEIKADLAEIGWGDIEEKTILNTCKVACDLDFYGTDVREIKDALLERPEILGQASRSLKAMADFLARRCNLLGQLMLPYTYQAVLIADAILITTGGSGEAMPEETEDALVRWFWLTTYGEYFAGINYSRLRKAVEHLRQVVRNEVDSAPPGLATVISPSGRFFPRNARARAIALLMAGLDPLGPDGASQNAHQLLAEHGKNATPKLFPDRDVKEPSAAEGAENRFVIYVRQAGLLRDTFLSKSYDTALLESHCLDEHAMNALHAGNLQLFLSHRRERLIRMERRFVESLGIEYSG